MLSFFRKIRWRLAQDNQFFRYSRYAIGEIVLVVIGILLALYINNWNERRKEKRKFDQLLIEVEKELVLNIEGVRKNLDRIYATDSILYLVINDSLERADYEKTESPLIFNIVFNYYLPTISDVSYKKLIELGSLSEEQDQIVKGLDSLYINRKTFLDDGTRFTIEMVQKNFNEIRDKGWYEELILAKRPSEDMIDFYLSNEYKAIVLEYEAIVVDAYRYSLEQFDIKGVEVYERIYDYFETFDSERLEPRKFRYTTDDFLNLTGTYIAMEYSTPYHTIEDSTVISIENRKLYYSTYFADGGSSPREMIPVSKYYFRTKYGLGFYHIIYDENDEVESIRHSAGVHFTKDVKIK